MSVRRAWAARRVARACLAAALATGLLPARARAEHAWREDPPPQQRAPALPGVQPPVAETAPLDEARSARAHAALQRGLEWLAREQGVVGDGSFPRSGGTQSVPVPITALAALAFMAGGSTPERGPYGEGVARAVDYLASRADLVTGSPQLGYIHSEGDPKAGMHGHGFATIALAEAWSMAPQSPRGQRLGVVLRAAVDRIVQSQGLEGGWFYEPVRTIDHENSVTVVLVQALRAAHGAGVHVDAEVIHRAVDYIRRCQSEDGSFRYKLASSDTSVALTAAGLSILNAAGVYSGPEVERGVEALWRRLGYRQETRSEEAKFPHYERFYLAQALWQHSDTRLFERWYAEEVDRVLQRQEADGSWSDATFGSSYATAMVCLFLALPDGLLPVFQR